MSSVIKITGVAPDPYKDIPRDYSSLKVFFGDGDLFPVLSVQVSVGPGSEIVNTLYGEDASLIYNILLGKVKVQSVM